MLLKLKCGRWRLESFSVEIKYIHSLERFIKVLIWALLILFRFLRLLLVQRGVYGLLIFLVCAHHRFDQIIYFIDILLCLWITVFYFDISSCWIRDIINMNFFKIVIFNEFFFSYRFRAQEWNNICCMAKVINLVGRLCWINLNYILFSFNDLLFWFLLTIWR